MPIKHYTRQEMKDLYKQPYSLWVQDGKIFYLDLSDSDFNSKTYTAIPPYRKSPADLINGIIGSRTDVDYLEIGVDEGETFDLINSRTKHGVDPYGGSPNITHKMPSQMFFAMNSYFYRQTYDIIFIDGCHMSKIILQEVEEALQILNPGGVIILHDTVPLKESAQLVIQEEYEHFLSNIPETEGEYRSFREYSLDNPWDGYNGDSWRAVYQLRIKPATENIMIYTTADACCTIVSQEPGIPQIDPPPPPEHDLNWEYFYKNCGSILLPMGFDSGVELFRGRLQYYKGQKNAS